ncbi:MAG: hypothetical protein EI684_18005 [Candidatus Viridilinea halotolerans]|uniref:Uncharacterized protein n=1 Tax=Candidatus Viridilinea halotolerans TaxID=2491704 RepID=A0A426TTL7_9CHLR|nr:MAG: hypothetical protein EI684_18005 [Candidatus Viridilinea halotolerans]
MFICSVTGDTQHLRVRYVPVAAWGFTLLVAFGIADIVGRVFDGRIVDLDGPLAAVAGLAGFAFFILYNGGQFVSIGFDRANDTLDLHHYGLKSLHTQRRISEVTALEVHILRRAQHRIELRLRSGERLPVTPYHIISITNRGLKSMSSLLGMEPTMIAPSRRVLR